MRYLFLLSLFIWSNAYSLEWKYKIYQSPDQATSAEWHDIRADKRPVEREFEGYIEYEATFDSSSNPENDSVYLGEIGDVDKTYINDVLIGQTGDFPPNYQYSMDIDRLYHIPKIVLNGDGVNKIRVVTYTRYLVNKGLNPKNVVFGESSILNNKKYLTDLKDDFSKIILPLLCLILAIISFPALAPKSLWKEQSIIFTMGISSFILGICRGRIGFHFLEMLLAYKLTIVSSIVTIWLIAVSSIGIKTRFHKYLSAIISIIALGLSTTIIFKSTLLEASNIATIWFHVAPFFLFAGVMCVLKDQTKNLPFKIGLVILFLTDVNDVLHDLHFINSPALLQVGLGIFVLLLITNQIIRLRDSWELFYKKEIDLEADARLGRQAIQLAHDIRSPLEAIKSAKDEFAKLPEEERLSVNMAIGRIEEIAYNLLVMRKKNSQKANEVTQVKSILAQLILEKRMQYREFSNLKFSFESNEDTFSVFNSMDSEKFKRIISNLLVNSAEAINFEGVVSLVLKKEESTFLVEVHDNGPKIDASKFKDLFKKGFTTKNDGNGLGLYYAKKEVELVKGEIHFEQNGKTIVSVRLPLASEPPYFIKSLNFKNIKRVIVLDDDESIHQVWKKRFKNTSLEIEHFYKAANLLSLYKEIPEDTFLLSDYELLGENQTGVDCINKLHSTKNSIIVSARADDPQVIKECEDSGIRLLSKHLANDVKIETEQKINKEQIVLIDDDDMIHLSWKIAARKSGVTLNSYKSVDAFINDANKFQSSTKIYIDSNLGVGLKGEVLSKEIFDLGYSELFLSTGHYSEDIEKPFWIKEIYGKQPVFLS